MKRLLGLGIAGLALVAAASGLNASLGHHPDLSIPEGRSAQVRVTSIVDGDTLRVEDLTGRNLGRVRILGIDAPEIAHPPAVAECYADRATNALESLTPIGATITITTDAGQLSRDRYGRMLRYVDIAGMGGDEGDDVAQELLSSGAARRYESDPALARDPVYAKAANGACNDNRGLWAHC